MHVMCHPINVTFSCPVSVIDPLGLSPCLLDSVTAVFLHHSPPPGPRLRVSVFSSAPARTPRNSPGAAFLRRYNKSTRHSASLTSNSRIFWREENSRKNIRKLLMQINCPSSNKSFVDLLGDQQTNLL